MTGRIGPGSPEPLGVMPVPGGVNVAVFSAHAARVWFCLFDAAGDGKRDLTCGDGSRGAADGIEPGGAEPVDRVARHRHRESREQQRHARDIAVIFARLVGAAEHDFLDQRRIERGMARQ